MNEDVETMYPRYPPYPPEYRTANCSTPYTPHQEVEERGGEERGGEGRGGEERGGEGRGGKERGDSDTQHHWLFKSTLILMKFVCTEVERLSQ